MARYSDTDIGLDTPTGGDQSGLGPLVEAPRQRETNALLADMNKQTLPIKFQGRDVYKDPQGNFRYGLAQGTEPRKVRFSDSDLDMEPKKESSSIVGNVVGSTAMVGDMILGFPAFVGGFVANLGAAGGSAAGGATREEAWAEGRKAQEAFMTGGPLAGWQSSPLGKLAELLGHKDTYEGSSVGEAMTKVSSAIEDAGKWVEEKSGGSIPKDSVLTFADSLMVGMGPAAARLIKGVKGNLAERRAREGEVLPPEGGERVEPTINNGLTIEGQPLTPEALAKQHVEARYADPTLQGPAAAQFWRDRGGEMRNTFDDPLARRQYEQAKRALVKERKNATKSPAVVVEERLAADPPREGTPQEILKQYKEEVLEEPAESTRISEGDATRLYQTPPALRTTEQRLQLKRYENGLRTEGMFGPGSVADQVKTYASKNPGVTGAALGAVAGGIAYLNSDEGDSVLPAVMASMMAIPAAHSRAKLAAHLEKIGAPRDRIWAETQLFKNEHGQWVKEIHNTDAGLNPNLPRVWNDPSKVVPGHLESGVPLGGILQDHRLYMNMPELADIPVLGEAGKNMRGSFDTKAGVMRLRPGEPEQVLSTALHETQHAIQTEKGMPGGGNPEQFLSAAESAFIREAEMRTGVLEGSIRKDTGAFDAALVQQAVEQVQKGQRMSAAVAREFNKIQNHPALPEYLKALEDRIKADDLYMAAREKYLRLPGEVEARVVQARMNMLPEELRKTPPWKTYGINADGWPTKLAVGAATVAAGGWLFLDEDAAEKIGVGGLVLAGAIKGKGGMWHPEAVTRLVKPLAANMTKLPIEYAKMLPEEVLTRAKALYPDDPALVASYVERANTDKAVVQWTDKAVRNWLNKHAGTATDPLKDVKVPMLGEDVTLGHIMDQVVTGETVPGPKGPETQWNIDARNRHYTEAKHAFAALQSYLSHAGDYAREFIPPDKLQQYDLVRLIKETAKQDEIQAAKMAKARVNQAGTVTFKEYPDGMKWVEVGVPDKEGVPKGYKIIEDEGPTWMVETPAGSPTKYVAQDSLNVRYDSILEAEKAAREHVANIALKNEGDVMGHCVGGYCEMVHSGESKIYSLRDEKGMSHVTVEVAPPDVRAEHNSPGYYAKVVGGDLLERLNAVQEKPERITLLREIVRSPEYQVWLNRNPSDIIQIKGKQNRAPVDKYLPYVQDFVKGGKWGEVGDLGNAGLEPLREAMSGTSHTFQAWAKDNMPAYVTPDEVNKAYQEFSRKETAGYDVGQRGSIDPDLAKKLGAGVAGAAIGAYLDKEDRISAALVGAGLGALGAGALSRAKGRNIPTDRGLDYMLGNVSTRVANLGEMGPVLRHQLVKFEGKVLKRTKEATDKVGPFLQDLKGMPKAMKQQVSLALLQGDMAKARQIMVADVQYLKDLDAVQQVLHDFERVHKQLGRFKEGITDYFPRIVKDYEGLQKHLGTQAAEGLDKWLNKAEKKMIRDENRLLTPVEESILINRYLQAEAPLSSLPPHLRKRTIREITEQLQPFYETPEVSLSRYVHEAVKDIEMAKLFGRNLKLSKASHGTRAINVDESIGAFVRDAKQAGHLTSSQEAQLKEILQSRFGPGEQGGRPFIQHVRNTVNAGLLGNIASAATQLGDAPMAYVVYGLGSSLRAIGKTLTGRSVDPKALGLANHISEEFSTTVSSAKALQKIFKYSLFSFADLEIGKRIILTAALDRYQHWSKTAPGQERIAEKYQKAFGSDFADLLRDLRTGAKSDNVDTLLFSELSGIQPVSKMEMPQLYHNQPNGRILYALHSFQLKQLDFLRRNVFQEIAKGGEHVPRGLATLAKYSIVVGIAGATTDMIKDFIFGKPFDAKWQDIPMNLLKTFGWSQYVLDKAKGGHPTEAVLNMAMPPWAAMDDVIRRDPKAWNYVPIIGKIYYERHKAEWKEQRAWDKKHDPDQRMERRMKRLEERQ